MDIRFGITGLTCESCVRKVETLLATHPSVERVHVNLAMGRVDLIASASVSIEQLAEILADTRYVLIPWQSPSLVTRTLRSVQAFLPLITMFAIVTVFTVAMGFVGGLNVHYLMSMFMGGFFVVFGSLKVFNLSGFARSYRAYDDIASRLSMWGYVYPFVEVALGVLFLLEIGVLYASIVTAVIMFQKAYSVSRNLLAGNQPQCACLGGFFTIRITWVTCAEDLLMALMGVVMVLAYVS